MCAMDAKKVTELFKAHIRGVNGSVIEEQLIQQSNILATIGRYFIPGEYFFIINDFVNVRLAYCDHSASKLLNLRPEKTDYSEILSFWHPDDLERFTPREKLIAKFLFEFIRPEHRADYKVTYTIKLNTKAYGYRNFLVQNIATQLDDVFNILPTISVFTDLSEMKIPYSEKVHFIGLNGRPSYRNIEVKPDPEFIVSEDTTLTSRERDTLQKLAQGHTQEQAAKRLNLSASTVRTHAGNILDKLEAKNQAEAIRIALQRGLIS